MPLARNPIEHLPRKRVGICQEILSWCPKEPDHRHITREYRPCAVALRQRRLEALSLTRIGGS
jgi:hypothetical protein